MAFLVDTVLGDALATLGAATSPFGNPSNGEWNLQRGEFTPDGQDSAVVFFYEKDDDKKKLTGIDQITDTGGRRLAVYEYPYRDGQSIADLGRKGESFTFNIKFWGPLYQDKFAEFIDRVVNAKVAGKLTHPVRGFTGTISARFKDYEFVHRFDEWNAITIKATFVEDQTDELVAVNSAPSSANLSLRDALQLLTSAQALIQQGIFNASALALLPGAIINGLIARVTSITGQLSALLGQLAVTFATDAQLIQTLYQAAAVGGIAGLTSGVTSSPTPNTTTGSASGTLPPVFQTGFDPVTQNAINTQVATFSSSNQTTPQEAVFIANTIRAAISEAIAELEAYFGNDAYDMVLQYRQIATSTQSAVEASISAAQSLIKIYTVPYPMSLRMVAFRNGLSPDFQNAIEALNPYLPSVNYVEKGTQVAVPVT